MPHVLVTGASGFVGQTVCSTLLARGMTVRAALRKNQPFPVKTETVVVGEINEKTDWTQALEGIDRIVHLAARVHVVNEDTVDPMAEFRRTNVQGTARLANQAIAAGVERFVYASSIHADPILKKETPYSLSKQESEYTLHEICQQSPMKTVILRPPLVYGPGVKAKMLALLRLCARNIPLPFASFSNRRDMISVDNLTDIIVGCLDSPAVAGKTYAIRDDRSLSIAELVTMIRNAMGQPARLFSFPPSLLLAMASLVGKRSQITALTEALSIDDSPLRRDLKWKPQSFVEDDVRKMTNWFLLSRTKGSDP